MTQGRFLTDIVRGKFTRVLVETLNSLKCQDFYSQLCFEPRESSNARRKEDYAIAEIVLPAFSSLASKLLLVEIEFSYAPPGAFLRLEDTSCAEQRDVSERLTIFPMNSIT